MYNRIAVISQRLEALVSELSELEHLRELVLEAEQRLDRINFPRTSDASKHADIAARYHPILDSGPMKGAGIGAGDDLGTPLR